MNKEDLIKIKGVLEGARRINFFLDSKIEHIDDIKSNLEHELIEIETQLKGLNVLKPLKEELKKDKKMLVEKIYSILVLPPAILVLINVGDIIAFLQQQNLVVHAVGLGLLASMPIIVGNTISNTIFTKLKDILEYVKNDKQKIEKIEEQYHIEHGMKLNKINKEIKSAEESINKYKKTIADYNNQIRYLNDEKVNSYDYNLISIVSKELESKKEEVNIEPEITNVKPKTTVCEEICEEKENKERRKILTLRKKR